MIQRIDDYVGEKVDYAQIKLLVCLEHHIPAQLLLLSVCFVAGGLMQLALGA